MVSTFSTVLAYAALAAAGPLLPRTVTSLDQSAVAEAQQRDNTATRAFSNVQIKVTISPELPLAAGSVFYPWS